MPLLSVDVRIVEMRPKIIGDFGLGLPWARYFQTFKFNLKLLWLDAQLPLNAMRFVYNYKFDGHGYARPPPDIYGPLHYKHNDAL